jgi:hypothetical protein
MRRFQIIGAELTKRKEEDESKTSTDGPAVLWFLPVPHVLRPDGVEHAEGGPHGVERGIV